MKFDKYEWQILQALQKDGRLSNNEIAEQIGLSTTPCWRRINELNNSGVIERYVALLNPQLTGIKEIVFANVSIDKFDESYRQQFEEAVKTRPEVLGCYASMGDNDYILKIAVPDIAAYDKFLQEFLVKLPGVRQTHSTFALRVIKRDTALPLEIYDSNVS